MPGSKDHSRLPEDDDNRDDYDYDRSDREDRREERRAGSRAHEPLPPPRTRVGEVLAQSRETGRFFATLTTAQFQSFILLIFVAFICSLLGFVMWKWEDRQKEDKASIFRYAESQGELSRQSGKQELTDLRAHCAKEATELRTYFADQDKRRDERETARDERRMRFEAEETQKTRVALAAIVTEQARWRELLKPLLARVPPVPEPNDEDGDCGPVARAPMPRPVTAGR